MCEVFLDDLFRHEIQPHRLDVCELNISNFHILQLIWDAFPPQFDID